MLDVNVIPSSDLIESAEAELKAADPGVLAKMRGEFNVADVPTIDEQTHAEFAIKDAYLLGYFTALVQASMQGGKL